MSLLLNLIYLLLVTVSAPGLLWSAWRHGKYRQGWRAKLWGDLPQRDGVRPCVWFHAVSVGEVNLLGPLLRDFPQHWPEHDCVVTTTTRSGYELASRKYAAHRVYYCPLDFSWAVRRALQRIRPKLIVLVELELWPNLVRLARQQGVTLALINGRLSERSFRGYRRFRWFFAPLLRAFAVIAVQNDNYAQRFLALGATPSSLFISGSLKFDGAETDRHQPAIERLRALWPVPPGDVVLLAGSTQEPEERLIIESYRCLADTFPHLRLILVPRHPERFAEVASLLDRSGLVWQRRSQLRESPASPVHPDARILLVDTVGELRHWWGVADVGFVGGSLGSRGGQSMIEPAGYGVAICFGPNTRNFREIVEMLREREAAEVVADGAELTQFVRRCLEDSAYRGELGMRTQQIVREQTGGVRRTLNRLPSVEPRRAA